MAEIENDPSWQSKLSTLRERVEYAFNNALFSDVQFTVEGSNGDKVTVTANKHILTVSSPVFEKMFHGKLAEKGPTIHLPDCTEDGLQEMLRYMHSDVVNLTGSNVMEVLYLAEKYMMPLLRDQCYEYLASELTPANVFTVLTQAQQSNNTRAEELCWNIVDFNTHRAVTSKAFLDISRDLLKQILERETLHTDEVNLFKAVDSWASNNIEEESKKEDGEAKRSVLGDEIVHLIRFPVMSQKEFADDALVSNVLRGSEMKEVVQIFSSIQPLQTSFKSVKRKGQWTDQWTKNRFTSIDTRLTTDDKTHRIVFEVNKPIFLAGIRLFAPQSDTKVRGTLRLSVGKLQPQTELFVTNLEFKNKKSEKIDDSYFGYTEMIDPPVFLLPQENYSVVASLENMQVLQGRTGGCRGWTSAVSYCMGSGGESVVQCDDIKITFMNFEKESNPGTTVNFGQFTSILLKRKVLLEKRLKTN